MPSPGLWARYFSFPQSVEIPQQGDVTGLWKTEAWLPGPAVTDNRGDGNESSQKADRTDAKRTH
jgi:hypothetical protein